MVASDAEPSACTEPTEKRKRKKKKQKPDKSEKSMVEESQRTPNENTKKKKRKKKASVSEDASDIKDVAPKKKKGNNKVLDEDMTSCDPETNCDILKGKPILDTDITSDDPTSTKGTQKKKKKVMDNETSACDPPTTDDAPRKKKKKNVVEETVTKKMIPKDDGVVLQTTNESALKSKAVSKDTSIPLEDPEDIVSKKKKKTKKALSSSRVSEDKDVTADHTTSGLDSSYRDGMSSSKLKKCKKSKQPKNCSEDEAPDTDGTVIQKKRKVSELEESRSPIEDQPKISDCAKVKKKRKKKKKKKKAAASVKTEDKVVEDHDVHHGEAAGDSLRVSKTKKTSQGSDIEESGHKECDLNGNHDITEGALKKKKKKKRGNKAKDVSELVDGTDESLQVTCHKEEKKKSQKKRKREEMLSQTANVDTSEVPKKKKKSKEETINSKDARKKQGEKSDVQLVSAQDGSTDEVHIDKVKRKALQEDINRESGNSKGTKFGQWDTATFQNSDQQTKFFRLLGGFKKGNQANLPSPSNPVKANMALGKEGEHVLERSLLEEFDKAVSWKKNRGTGLGFQPAQKATFYIDKTASKSIKFED